MTENRETEHAETIAGLRHMALRNALYHLARRRWLEGISRWFNFSVILFGTGAAIEFGSEISGIAQLPVALAAVTAAIGAAQLTFNFSGRSRDHEILQQRYFNLMADIEECTAPDKAQVAKFTSEFSRIAGNEPPTMRALDAIADNQATAALFGSESRKLKVTWLQSTTRHLVAHNGGEFPPIEQQ